MGSPSADARMARRTPGEAAPMTEAKSFPLPSDLKVVPGTEAAQAAHPYYTQFVPEDDQKFWFYNSMHFPEPMHHFDMITAEAAYVALGAFNTRVHVLPTAKGIEHRVINGRVYIGGVAVTDPVEIAERVEQFQQRAFYYYEHWERLYDQWKVKMKALIADAQALPKPSLPDYEPIETTHTGKGVASNHALLDIYQKQVEGYHRMWHHHFEFLLLGYGAYMTFFDFCKKAFPEISDQAISRMVAGMEAEIFRPDEEVKRLARRAVELGVDQHFTDNMDIDAVLADLDRVGNSGKEWLGELETEQRIAERNQLVSDYRELLDTEEDRATYDQLIGLAHRVFPYVEGHKFYCEHWYTNLFFNKIREFGALLAENQFFGPGGKEDDVFHLNQYELESAIIDLMLGWGIGATPRGPAHWPAIVAQRKAAIEEWGKHTTSPALGAVPDVIDDPAIVMLWGITRENLDSWLNEGSEGDPNELKGFAACSGVVEGTARVVKSVAEIGRIQQGDILVCQVTNPTWSPIFQKIGAAVSDIGGSMSHMAIVAREYGLPAVFGTGSATTKIKDGQRIRVDGGRGIVTILEDEPVLEDA